MSKAKGYGTFLGCSLVLREDGKWFLETGSLHKGDAIKMMNAVVEAIGGEAKFAKKDNGKLDMRYSSGGVHFRLQDNSVLAGKLQEAGVDTDSVSADDPAVVTPASSAPGSASPSPAAVVGDPVNARMLFEHYFAEVGGKYDDQRNVMEFPVAKGLNCQELVQGLPAAMQRYVTVLSERNANALVVHFGEIDVGTCKTLRDRLLPFVDLDVGVETTREQKSGRRRKGQKQSGEERGRRRNRKSGKSRYDAYYKDDDIRACFDEFAGDKADVVTYDYYDPDIQCGLRNNRQPVVFDEVCQATLLYHPVATRATLTQWDPVQKKHVRAGMDYPLRTVLLDIKADMGAGVPLPRRVVIPVSTMPGLRHDHYTLVIVDTVNNDVLHVDPCRKAGVMTSRDVLISECFPRPAWNFCQNPDVYQVDGHSCGPLLVDFACNAMGHPQERVSMLAARYCSRLIDSSDSDTTKALCQTHAAAIREVQEGKIGRTDGEKAGRNAMRVADNSKRDAFEALLVGQLCANGFRLLSAVLEANGDSALLTIDNLEHALESTDYTKAYRDAIRQAHGRHHGVVADDVARGGAGAAAAAAADPGHGNASNSAADSAVGDLAGQYSRYEAEAAEIKTPYGTMACVGGNKWMFGLTTESYDTTMGFLRRAAIAGLIDEGSISKTTQHSPLVTFDVTDEAALRAQFGQSAEVYEDRSKKAEKPGKHARHERNRERGRERGGGVSGRDV